MEPSIEFLELFAVLASVDMWGHLIQNHRIALYCDNQAVVHMFNNATSSCKRCMILISRLTLTSMIRNIMFCAYLIDNGSIQSQTVKSYIPAIKAIVKNDGYCWDDNRVMLGTLMQACKLQNDRLQC